MKFVAFVMIVMIASVVAAPQPHKFGFGVPAVAVAEPIVPVPIVPIVQPIVQPIPIVQSYYPVVPIVGRFG